MGLGMLSSGGRDAHSKRRKKNTREESSKKKILKKKEKKRKGHLSDFIVSVDHMKPFGFLKQL